MATHDPMDLDSRSQAFYRDFYQFHQHSCDAWYIKDTNHRFTDGSITFLSRFLPHSVTSVIGLCDEDIAIASSRDIHLVYDFESQVMIYKKAITLLVWNYFSDCNDIKSFILKMMPYQHDGKSSVITYVSDLFEINKNIDWLPSLIPGVSKTVPNGKIDYVVYVDPLSYVTEGEWEVAWLIICACPIRWIASNFDVSVKAVEIKARNVYMKMRVFNREGLLQMAMLHGWVNIIPKRFVAESNIIRVC